MKFIDAAQNDFDHQVLLEVTGRVNAFFAG
jgi:hypothetical protein